MILRVLVLTPAPYSDKLKPNHLRDYRIFGTSGPYGTLAEWVSYAEAHDFDRIEYRTIEGIKKSIKIEVDR